MSKAVGGQKLHIKVQETVYHPGHYRVALAGELGDRASARSESHEAGRRRAVYGGTWLKQSWRVHISPLRESADHGGSIETVR